MKDEQFEVLVTMLSELKKEVSENEALLLHLLKINGEQTQFIYDEELKKKSSEQQAKDFWYNVLTNLVADTVEMPKIIR